MPSIQEHTQTAERFAAMYAAIPAEFPEGRALALFYSSLHFIEAAAATEQPAVHNRTHAVREQWLMNNHPRMVRFYLPLWQESEKARYLAGGAFIMNASAVEEFLRKKHHVAIERWARAIILPTP